MLKIGNLLKLNKIFFNINLINIREKAYFIGFILSLNGKRIMLWNSDFKCLQDLKWIFYHISHEYLYLIENDEIDMMIWNICF